MATDNPSPLCLDRLADQMRVLSELTETLTYRLLELEEKLAVSEESLRPFREAEPPCVDEEMESRLLATEEKLDRIESMLKMVDRPGSTRHLLALHVPAFQQEPFPLQLGHDPLGESEPFLDEEGEQRFMDELIA